MSEEIKNESAENEAPAATPAQEATPVQDAAPSAAPAESDSPANETAPAEEPAASGEATSTTQPQVIVQRERDFAHYVGFALLSVISIIFFFIPGIAITFGVSRLVENLPCAAVWIFSAILSFIIWLIFKLMIKGFKKSFYFYIGLCIVIFIIFVVVEILTENTNVFSSIFQLLTGTTKAPTP